MAVPHAGIAEIDARLSRKHGTDGSGRQHARRIKSIEDEYQLLAMPDDQDPGMLGRGSYGIVRRYEKRDLPHLAHVPSGPLAVKAIEKRRVSTSATSVKHVMIEVAVLKHLKHENIIRMYDVVHTDDTIYMVMELCSGGELYHFIAENRLLQPEQAAVILKQILLALHYIHSNHVVHRDIKPENILIDRNDLHIKIIDFGLSKYCGPSGGIIGLDFPQSPSPGMMATDFSATAVPPSPLVASTPCGTDLYLSLESICGILQGTRSYMSTKSRLPKVDVYGAGVIAYAMLTGKLPYRSVYRTVKRTPQERQRRLQDLKGKMDGGVVFPASSQTLPLEALECVRDLMTNDPTSRPTALEGAGFAWLKEAKIPTRAAQPEKVAAVVQVKEVKEKPAFTIMGPPKKKGRPPPATAPIPDVTKSTGSGYAECTPPVQPNVLYGVASVFPRPPKRARLSLMA